ncbi:MAG: hypothetical protein MUC90_07675 [Thermoplasmata archaeon]|nr:hypothetical protein [Thermoplasmata archaeon]
MVQILRSRDFSVEEKEGYLFGKRDDISVVVMVASDMLSDDVRDFVTNVSGFPGRKVVASLGKIEDSVQSYLQRHGVHYWGREEVEHEIGSLQLVSTDGRPGKSLMDEVISDELPQRVAEPPEHAIPVIVESAEERAERIVKPNFMLDDVKYLARHEVQGYKYDLELVPHYLFHFILNLGDGKQKAGIASVNALTGHVETWRWGFELVDSIDLIHMKREPKIDYELAKQTAQDLVSKEYKSHTETVRDYGHSEIIERKKSPEDSMILEFKGLVYLPVWCVEGRNGAMIINSSSGKIISEHLHGGDQAPESKLG